MSAKAKCDFCGRERVEGDKAYDAIALLEGEADPGWYSGDDGEICGEDMVKLFRRANGL